MGIDTALFKRSRFTTYYFISQNPIVWYVIALQQGKKQRMLLMVGSFFINWLILLSIMMISSSSLFPLQQTNLYLTTLLYKQGRDKN